MTTSAPKIRAHVLSGTRVRLTVRRDHDNPHRLFLCTPHRWTLTETQAVKLINHLADLLESTDDNEDNE